MHVYSAYLADDHIVANRLFYDVLGALAGIFSQILHGDEQIRERAITFLSTKIRVLLVEDLLPKDAEEELVALCKKVKYRVYKNETISHC